MKRSGIHFTANNNKDLVKIVNNVVQQEALKDSVRVMHCRLSLLFTFYSNTTNSDKNTSFGTFLIKITQKEQGLEKDGLNI
jgi:transcriptional regulator